MINSMIRDTFPCCGNSFGSNISNMKHNVLLVFRAAKQHCQVKDFFDIKFRIGHSRTLWYIAVFHFMINAAK